MVVTARTGDRLLRVAGEMLEREGLDAVTLRALGAAAGVSRAAPYRHFSDKDELLAAVATKAMRELREAMIEAGRREDADGDPLGRLERMLTAYLDVALAKPAHYRLVFGTELSRREFPDLVAEASAAYKLLVKTVIGAQTAGVLPPSAPPLGISALLLSTTHGLVDLLVSRHGIPEKGLGDPRTLIRLLLNSIHC